MCDAVRGTECSEVSKVVVEDGCQAAPTIQLPAAGNMDAPTRKEDFNDDQEASRPWIHLEDITLIMAEKKAIETGEMLTDKHINLAQKMLKRQFPDFNGLRLTLLQNKPHRFPTSNTIQIFHIKGNHWVCAATHKSGKQVLVCDSAYSSWDKASLALLQAQFRCSMGCIKLVNGIQKQAGGTECGLFAIAFATTIAFHGDPAVTTYNQALMRSHLIHCFRDTRTIPLAIACTCIDYDQHCQA